MPITHVVLVAWAPGEAAQAEAAVRPAVRAFLGVIPGLTTLVEGHSTSPEGLEDGFEYAIVGTFDSPEARDAYLVHPAHVPVGAAIQAAAARVAVFDL